MELSFGYELLLALGGFLFHLLKQYAENIKRKEAFDYRLLIIHIAMNLIAIPILIFIGGTLPEDLLVMSPLTCVIIGAMGSSILSGFINTKKPSSADNNNLNDDDEQADVLEYQNRNSFPETGLPGYWYLDTATDNYYYWDGRQYVNWPGPRPPKPPMP